VTRAVALALAAPFAQQAVQAAQSDEQLPEVVVTAQKRSQDIQEVPIAITAFTGDALQDKGLGDLRALTNLTPNVNLDAGSPFSGDTSVLSASIRGIGQDDFAFNLDPGVGVYLDGVFLARTIGANQNLLDVDRIEILKGPQGTLFGRNTIGGAINIVTHTPGNESRFIATASTGKFDRRDFAFTADMPVSANFLTSLSVSSQVRDGYQKVIPYPTDTLLGSTPFVVDGQTDFPKAGYDTSSANGGQNLKVIRGKALWHASEGVDVTFAADWSKQDQSAFPTTVLSVVTPATGANGLPQNVDTFPGPAFGFMGSLYNYCISTPAATLNAGANFGGLFNTSYGLCSPRGKGLGLAAGGAALGGVGYVGGPGGNSLLTTQPRIYWNFANTQTGDKDTTYASGPSFAKFDSWGASTTVDWSLPGNAALKSITGVRRIDWRVGVDLDGTPETIQEVTDHQFQKQFSQEFQLSGKAFDKLDWVAGLYYFQEKGYVHDFVPFGGGLYIYDVANDVDTKSYAAFTHLDYRLNEQWGFTLGARYSRDDKDFEGGQADLTGYAYKSAGCNTPAGPDMDCWEAFVTTPGSPGFGLAPFPDASNPYRYFPPGTQTQKYNVFTPTAGVQFHATEDVMLYSSFSKGFKAGGWTTRLSNPLANIDDAAFGPEKARTVELGVKSQLLNRRLQVNAAVFDTKYTGIQLNIQEGASPVLHNAGDAKLRGAELELQAVAGRGFSVNMAAGYIDAKYSDVSASAASQGITEDNEIPKTPKYKVSFGPQYDLSLPDAGSLRFGVDVTRTASMYNDATNLPQLYRPAVTNLNAAVHYFSADEKYQLTLGGTNLGDKRYITVGSANGAEGEIVGTYSRPREWYATIRVKMD
jgi:iron complex outermembrane receptor protein